MCGIFAFLGKSDDVTWDCYEKIKHRGPDNTRIKCVENIENNLIFIFHRLAINGLDRESDQPLCINDVHLICNGEIYNYKKLIEENNFNYQTHSDCEIIIHMYLKYGIDYTIKHLDGVFAFVLYDSRKKKVFVGRDPIGIRPLFLGNNKLETLAFASEAKALVSLQNVSQFPPGTYWEFSIKKITPAFVKYYDVLGYQIKDHGDEEQICLRLRELLVKSVQKRMMSDRKICALLSGGLDSTLVARLLNDEMKKRYGNEIKLNTYSIGLPGSVDLYYARKAAEYLGTNHYEIIVTEDEFLHAIEKTIYQIESFCTTSVRASVGNYLISLYIKRQGKNKGEGEDDTVVFAGDLSDEIFASYRGFQKADTAENFFKENLKLLRDVHYFDVLRSDRCISGAGLESRLPFEDRDFIDFVMTLDPKFKMFSDERMEKYLLRKAFIGYLPDELLWRRKEAFSDGVSSHERSWFQIIKDFVDKKYTDREFDELSQKYLTHLQPYDKESLYYREIFEKYYPGRGDNFVPYYWRHPFSKNLDPSARCLDHYCDHKK